MIQFHIIGLKKKYHSIVEWLRLKMNVSLFSCLDSTQDISFVSI